MAGTEARPTELFMLYGWTGRHMSNCLYQFRVSSRRILRWPLPEKSPGSSGAIPASYQIAFTGWRRLSSLCRRRLKHHGRLGPPPIMNFLVGAVREPPLRVDFHGKACGYQLRGDHTGKLSFVAGLAGRRLDHAGTLLGLQSNSGAVASRPHSQTYFKSSILPLQ